jgi:hypothetical protein
MLYHFEIEVIDEKERRDVLVKAKGVLIISYGGTEKG